MDLHTAGHRRGVVCAPHHAAAEAGRAVLAEGGNALEAMVAMAATIAAVYPHMNHIGGDGFWLVREPIGPRARDHGGGPRRRRCDGASFIASTRRSRRAGRSPRSPCRARSRGWMLALEAARGDRRHGCRSTDLLAPPSGQARDGYVVTQSQARLTAEKLAELKDVPGFAQTFLPDGKPPEAGTTLQQTALAATLDHLAHAGLDDFYRGDVGREIAADLERIGSPVTRADLAALPRRCIAEPLSRQARRRHASTTRRRRRRGSPR